VRSSIEAVLPLWLDRPDLEALEIAEAAGAAGLDGLWIGEMATFDAFALATAIGARVPRLGLRVGPLPVSVRTPVSIALGASSVAALTGCEIDIAVASIDLAGAEIAMSTMIGRERSLQKAFEPILEDYDFICIDTPPSLGLLTINALTAADKVIVPVQCEYLSMRGLIQLQNTLAMIRENLNPGVDIEGILPTLVDSRTIHAKEAIEILEENFGDRVFASRIRKTVRFAEAPVKGMSVLKYEPDGVAAQSYRQLAREVLARRSEEVLAGDGT